jgi:hypothetical protein
VALNSLYPPGEESSDLNEGELRTGDTVRVELDPGEFKSAQEGHGGWEDFMAEVYTYELTRLST